MRTLGPERGFTILETMIFLAVSGFILISALALMSGRQVQIQYQQAVREYDAVIRATVNDVSTGFFPGTAFSCEEGPDSMVFSIAAAEQGTRGDCVFAGKAIAFNENDMDIFTLAAKRTPFQASAVDANLEKITPIAGSVVSLTEAKQNKWGLEQIGVSDEAGNEVAFVAFVAESGSSLFSTGQEGSGMHAVRLFKGTDLSLLTASSPGNIGSDLSPVDRDDAIYVCLVNPEGNRKAVIIIGRDGRSLSTVVDQDASGKFSEQCGEDF